MKTAICKPCKNAKPPNHNPPLTNQQCLSNNFLKKSLPDYLRSLCSPIRKARKYAGRDLLR
jgi:hypothetical protein